MGQNLGPLEVSEIMRELACEVSIKLMNFFVFK